MILIIPLVIIALMRYELPVWAWAISVVLILIDISPYVVKFILGDKTKNG